jgi:hypothetical protein
MRYQPLDQVIDLPCGFRGFITAEGFGINDPFGHLSNPHQTHWSYDAADQSIGMCN